VSERVLILGGTKEAALLATKLVQQGDHVTTSLAGRTSRPGTLAGSVRIGGFGGAEKLAAWLHEHQITRFIDATHPFALQISRNALRAADLCGVPLEVHRREPWVRQPGDLWTEVDDLETAARAIPTGERVLLAIGSQYLQAFASRSDVHFVTRMVDPPKTKPDLTHHSLVLGQPPSDWRMEADLIRNHDISTIVCRNAGGEGAYAKIIAARALAIPVIMIKVPS